MTQMEEPIIMKMQVISGLAIQIVFIIFMMAAIICGEEQ